MRCQDRNADGYLKKRSATMCNPYETGGTCSGSLIRPVPFGGPRKPGIVAFSLLWQVGSWIITELTPSSARSQLGASGLESKVTPLDFGLTRGSFEATAPSSRWAEAAPSDSSSQHSPCLPSATFDPIPGSNQLQPTSACNTQRVLQAC